MPEICSATKKDGTPCSAVVKKDGLCLAHLPHEDKPVTMPAAAKAAANKPAFLKGIKPVRAARFGQRMIKMVRPSCDECQVAYAPFDWYKACTHDPYVSVREKRTQVPIYSEPNDDGSVTVQTIEERVTFEPWPNLVQVAVQNMVNSGEGVERGRRKGYIMVEELDSPAFPNGLASMCQFRNCFWQHDLKQYQDGTFHKDEEATIVSQFFTNRDRTGSMRYGAVEVMHPAKMADHRARVKI